MIVNKCLWVYWQTLQATADHLIPMRDSSKLASKLAYRCLYCGEWFDHDKGLDHFGASDKIQMGPKCSRETHRIEISESAFDEITIYKDLQA